MKQGALIFDKESGRYNIRFGLNGSGDTGVCGAHSGKAEEADRGRICRACVSAC